MPRYNGTGPLGQGPGTGWGMGPCGAGIGWRKGFGQGYGRRNSWGCRAPYQPQMTEKEEKEILEEEAEILEDELKSIKKRLTELKGQN